MTLRGKRLMEKDRNTCFLMMPETIPSTKCAIKKSFCRLETNPHLSSRRGPAPDLSVTRGSWRRKKKKKKKSFKSDSEDEASHGSGNLGSQLVSVCRRLRSK